MPAARLAVAVVNYRTPDLAEECLRRLEAAEPGAELRLVDTDPTAEFERRFLERHPRATYVPAANRSYAHAVNVGLAGADAEFLALMNADVTVAERTFEDLLEALEADPGAGAAGPLALDATGRPQDLGPCYARHYRALRHRPAGRRPAGAPASVPVPWLSGALHVVRREDWLALGGYDEGFRFFNEDLDFGLRLAAAGRRSLLVASEVVHLGGASTPAHPAFHVEGRRGGLVVARRHHPGVRYEAQRAFVLLEAWLGRACARRPEWRAAYAELLRIARRNDLSATPFGATLDERPGW